MPEFNTFRLADAISDGQNLAMNQHRLGETQRGIQARQGLETALRSGTPEAMATYRNQFPMEAQKYQAEQDESNDKKLQRALNQISVIEKVASGVQDEDTYQRGKQLLTSLNIDTSQFPESFDPQWVQQQMQQTLGYKGQVEMALRQEQKKMETEKFEETKRHNRATESLQRDNQPLVQVDDPTSPTGTRYLTRDEAQGKVAPRKAASNANQQKVSSKLASIRALKQQLAKVKAAFEGEVGSDGKKKGGLKDSWSAGKGTGWLPTESGDAFDNAVALLSPLSRQLTRTAGEGSMSDYESRLAQMALPSRNSYESVTAKQIQDWEDLINVIESGYGEMSSGPTEAPNNSRKVVRTGTSNGRKVVQYDDGSVEYAD